MESSSFTPEMQEALDVFKDLKSKSPKGEVGEWMDWMIQEAHQLWREKKISHEIFARVVDEIICY